MIKGRVMGLVMRGEQLGDEDWRKLLAERERTIRPKLKGMATATLGALCFSSPSATFTLSEIAREMDVCENSDFLQTRGIFGITSLRDKAEDCGNLCAFGLRSDGRWYVYRFDVRNPRHGFVFESEACFPPDFEVFDLSYRRLFNLLGRATEAWMRRREKSYRQSLDLYRDFELERNLLDELESKFRKD